MIVVIDNYDSFTYNLVQMLEELGQACIVIRNDQATVEEVEQLNPDYILISPGPGVPETAGISMDVIRRLGRHIPILGVCLGHQAIAKVYGGEIILSPQLMHGRSSLIQHRKSMLFNDIPVNFPAGRYHSWIIDLNKIPKELEVTAQTNEGEIMAIRHKSFPIEGVQFHPESILTPNGKEIIVNFLNGYKKSQAC